MDKKNTFIGALLIVAAFASLYLGQKFAPPAPAPAPSHASVPATATSDTTTAANVPSASSAPSAAAVSTVHVEETTTTIENDWITVHLTNYGGAIRDIALRHFPAELHHPEPYVFNAVRTDPMLAFVDYPGLDRHTSFELVSKTATEVVYRAVLAGQVEVTRRFSIVTAADTHHDPYQVRHETTFRNLTEKPVPMSRVSLSLGTVSPVNESVYGQKVSSGFSNGSKQTFIDRAELEAGSGFAGIGAHPAKPNLESGGPIAWASLDNQFFASILTPDQPGTGLVTTRLKVLPAAPDDQRTAYGLAGAAQFDVKPLPAHGQQNLGSSLYVGPKEYNRLSNSDVFKADQDKVMQFGVFKFFSQILLIIMTWVHKWLPSWGLAIVITTLLLKIFFLPFTLAASRSAKRMQKIQPEMQAVKEKFKDNPQKLQAATMELFKKHKVNPLGGCIPMLITLPFFWGFYTMLRSAAELRFEPFLWAPDLAASDTITHVFGFPLNIMPLLMGATMIVQMRLTPQPSVDNAQAKMMKFMPLLFVVFCYTYSCALALYSTINGLFTIGQQLIINRMKDPIGDTASAGGIALETASAFSKPVKNVTPKKKK